MYFFAKGLKSVQKMLREKVVQDTIPKNKLIEFAFF